MKLIYLKSALKCDSFDVAIDIKIQFFRVLVTIELGSLLTTVCYHELFDWKLFMNADSYESKHDIMTNKKHTALYKVKISLFKFFFQ